MLSVDKWSILWYFALPLFAKYILMWGFLWQKREYRKDRMLDYLGLMEAKKLLLDKWLITRIILIFSGFGLLIFQASLDVIQWFWFAIIFSLGLETVEFLFKLAVKKITLKPVLTEKAFIILSLSWLQILAFIVLWEYIWQPVWILLSLQMVILIIPGILGLAIFVIQPLENWRKKSLFASSKSYREMLKELKVVAISGAFGKTTTKSLLDQLLGTKYSVVATSKFQNTAIAVAKSLLSLPNQTDFFLSEIGSYKKGEGSSICDFVLPNIAIITGLNLQHYALFGSEKNVIEAESESLKYLTAGNKVYINYGSQLCKKIEVPTSLNLIRYGVDLDGLEKENFDVRAIDVIFGLEKTSFTFLYGKIKVKLATNLQSKGNLENLIGTLALCVDQGIKIADLTSKLLELSLPEQTLNIINDGSCVIIDDSHNANFDGVLNSLELVKQYQNGDYQPIIVIDDVLELGSLAKEIHQTIGKKLSQIKDAKYFLVGRNYAGILEKVLLQEGIPNTNIFNVQKVPFQDLKNKLEILKNQNPPKVVVLYEGYQSSKYR